MKKLVILLGFVFALTLGLRAQNPVAMDDGTVLFNAHLIETFILTIVPPGEDQDITFTTGADYLNGVDETNGIIEGYTDITVDATSEWQVTIEADNFTPTAGAIGYIPVDNLGVYCTENGTYEFGNQVVCPYVDATSALGMPLTGSAVVLLDNGTSNTGDATANAFRLHWLMGTHSSPTMNPLTMIEQMAAGDFGVGDYTSTAYLTLYKLP